MLALTINSTRHPEVAAQVSRADGPQRQISPLPNVQSPVDAADCRPRSARGCGRFFLTVVSAFLLLLSALPCHAIPHLKRKPDPAVASFDDYVKRMRAMNPAAPATLGSLWVSSGSLATMSKDYKARNLGDLIIIHLVDNFTAATAGENKQTRQFNTNSAITGLLGTVAARSRLQNLFAANSATNLDGKGQSTMSSNVSLNFAASVMEVLPNGILVIEAARDITVGNDRQTVVMHGLVRPGDLAPDNSIPSTAISNLEVQIKGKGAVADITRQPNIIIRTILKIFTF